MEGPGSSLFEMDDFSPDFGLDVTSSLFEGSNINTAVKFSDIQQRPHVVENYSCFTKDNCQASEKLVAMGVPSLNGGSTYINTNNTIEDHSYVSMPSQEIDCSKLNGIDERQFFEECVGIPNAGHPNTAENDDETPALNCSKNSEPEFIPQKCDKKKNPHYLVSCIVQYVYYRERNRINCSGLAYCDTFI